MVHYATTELYEVANNPSPEKQIVSLNPTILCIDDEVVGLQVRKTVLERAGYRVLTARDGHTGLSLFGGEPIDAVVLDYSMPGMDGSQVATEMRRSKPQIPIMLLSAYVSLPEDVLRLVDTFLTKGEGPHALLTKIAELVRRIPQPEGAGA